MNAAAIDQSVFVRSGRLARVKRLVETHYGEPLPLQAAARAAGLERTYFCKYFRRKTGVGYRAWLNSTRVERALALLSRGGLTITDIALEVGFADLRTFERAFQRHTGHCAQTFRKQLRSSTHLASA